MFPSFHLSLLSASKGFFLTRKKFPKQNQLWHKISIKVRIMNDWQLSILPKGHSIIYFSNSVYTSDINSKHDYLLEPLLLSLIKDFMQLKFLHLTFYNRKELVIFWAAIRSQRVRHDWATFTFTIKMLRLI